MTATGCPQPIDRTPGDLVWRLYDGTNILEGFLAERGVSGTEFRLYFNRAFSFSARYATRDEAEAELAFQRSEALRRGFEQVFPHVATTGAA